MSQASPTIASSFPPGGQLSPRSAKRPRPGDGLPSAQPGTLSNSAQVVEDPFQHEAPDEDDDVDDDDDGGGRNPAKKAGRRKIKIEFIQDKSRRHITFSKRKAGIMKKAYELSTLTGTQVLLLVVSETGLVYTFTTAKLQPLVTQPEGKNLIQACLNAPNGAPPQSTAAGSGGESDSSPTMHNRKPPVGIGIGNNTDNSNAGPPSVSSVVMGQNPSAQDLDLMSGGGLDSPPDTRPAKTRKLTTSDAPGTGSSDTTAATTSPRSPTAPRPQQPGVPYNMGYGYPGAPPQSAGSGSQQSPTNSATPQSPMGLPTMYNQYTASPTNIYNPYANPGVAYGQPVVPGGPAAMPRAASSQGRQSTAGSVGAGVGGVGTAGSLSGWNSTGGGTRR